MEYLSINIFSMIFLGFTANKLVLVPENQRPAKSSGKAQTLEKYESQLGRIIPYIIETKMFQTTNQIN
jgi:hypothetical protein